MRWMRCGLVVGLCFLCYVPIVSAGEYKHTLTADQDIVALYIAEQANARRGCTMTDCGKEEDCTGLSDKQVCTPRVPLTIEEALFQGLVQHLANEQRNLDAGVVGFLPRLRMVNKDQLDQLLAAFATPAAQARIRVLLEAK